MEILFMTIPVTFLLVTFFIVAFLSAIRSDQFEDLETPSHSLLIEEEIEQSTTKFKEEKKI